MQNELWEKPQPKEKLFSLDVPGRLPSWNEILGMEHWARYKFKEELQDAFSYALRASAADCSTKTISARNTSLTALATLACYRETRLQQRKLKSAKKKLEAKKQSLQESKSSKSEVPF